MSALSAIVAEILFFAVAGTRYSFLHDPKYEPTQLIEAATPLGEQAELTPPTPAAGPTAAHAEQMPPHGFQRRAKLELTGDVALERRKHVALCRNAPIVEPRVEMREQPRILIRGTTDHDSVDMRELCNALLERDEPAVDDDLERGELALQTLHSTV